MTEHSQPLTPVWLGLKLWGGKQKTGWADCWTYFVATVIIDIITNQSTNKREMTR
jgi:hypothetical protein